MTKNFKEYTQYMDGILENVLPQNENPFSELYKAMKYSLTAGGKRIRPVLMKLAYEAVGGEENIDPYLCAIEMVHTYSLIHDDLPARDNDDYRRGKPTNHKVFGEATAILAGDALLNDAFTVMLEDALCTGDNTNKFRAIQVLSIASGSKGMIGGQILDIKAERKQSTLEDINLIQLNKTGRLITAALKMGAILGQGSNREVSILEAYGQYIGKVFQIIDDVLDEISTEEELGKPIHSDQKNEKLTYLNFYSVDQCYQIAEDYTNKAIKLLGEIQGDTELLEKIAKELITRRN